SAGAGIDVRSPPYIRYVSYQKCRGRLWAHACPQAHRGGGRQEGALRIKSVVYSVGQSGYLHRDLMAIKAGARADGFIFHGKPVLPGYDAIVEVGTTISVLLVLEDGQVAFGD